MIPFVAHVVDKNSLEGYSEVTNGYTTDNKPPLAEYLSKFQNENYYECDGAEIHDLTMDLNADTTGEDEEIIQNNQSQQQHGFTSSNRKRKLNTNSSAAGLDPMVNEQKPFETVKRLDTSLDEHDHFLHSLAPELRKINPKYTLHFRNEVHNLIIKYQSMSSNEQ